MWQSFADRVTFIIPFNKVINIIVRVYLLDIMGIFIHMIACVIYVFCEICSFYTEKIIFTTLYVLVFES